MFGAQSESSIIVQVFLKALLISQANYCIGLCHISYRIICHIVSCHVASHHIIYHNILFIIISYCIVLYIPIPYKHLNFILHCIVLYRTISYTVYDCSFPPFFRCFIFLYHLQFYVALVVLCLFYCTALCSTLLLILNALQNCIAYQQIQEVSSIK